MPRYPKGYFSKAKMIEVVALRRELKKRGVDTSDMTDEELWQKIDSVGQALSQLSNHVESLIRAVKALDPLIEHWLKR